MYNVAPTVCGPRADVKSSNRKHRNDKMNRAIQNFLYGALQVQDRPPSEAAHHLSSARSWVSGGQLFLSVAFTLSASHWCK